VNRTNQINQMAAALSLGTVNPTTGVRCVNHRQRQVATPTNDETASAASLLVAGPILLVEPLLYNPTNDDRHNADDDDEKPLHNDDHHSHIESSGSGSNGSNGSNGGGRTESIRFRQSSTCFWLEHTRYDNGTIYITTRYVWYGYAMLRLAMLGYAMMVWYGICVCM
jgi:hypothetical protein